MLQYVKPMWYKVVLIWAVTNRSMAMFMNLSRKRRVPQNILHAIHNACNEFIPRFLKGSYGSDVIGQIDDAWIAFGSGDNLQVNEIENPCVKLTKVSGGFEFPDGVEEMLLRILGTNEEDVSSPRIYISNDDAFSRMHPAGYDKHGNVIYKTDEIDFLRH